MANYFIQGSDGRFYGPADEATLDQWATEGRVLADTAIVEQGTNRQMTARDLIGLQHHFKFAPKHVPQQQQQQPYQPPGGTGAQPSNYGAYQQSPYLTSYPRPGLAPAGYSKKNKLIAAALAFFLGPFGVHRFYLGYTSTGIWMIVITVGGSVLCFIGPLITSVWALYDMVLILMGKMPDANGYPLQ